MIDHITITLSDTGSFSVNVGNVNFVQTQSIIEVLATVKDSVKNLGYFPSGKQPGCVNPISYEEFQKALKKQNK